MSTLKLNGITSGSSVLKAPDSGSTGVIFTLPASTGTLLTTDGDGSSLTGVGVDGISSSANATAITIDSSENVGVGSTTLRTALEVSRSQNGKETLGDSRVLSLQDNYGAANDRLEIGMGYWHPSKTYQPVILGTVITDDAGQPVSDFYIATKSSTDGNVAPTERFRITKDGRGLSQFTAKVWCSYDLNGTASIYDSYNVSSLTDNGTGDTTVNFTNNMGNASYSVAGMSNDMGYTLSLRDWTYMYAGSVRLATTNYASSLLDARRAMMVVFGD